MFLEEQKKPRFAVCLAAYNGMKFIAVQLESILAQQDVDVRVFISVDRSTDGTEEHLKKWASNEPRLSLLPFGQRFGGAGPNFYRLLREVDLSGYDYVSFADQDDIWHHQKLSRAHVVLSEKHAMGYSSNFRAFWPSGKTREVNKATPQRSSDYLFESAGPGCTYVVRAELANQLQSLVREANPKLARIDYHDWLFYAYTRFHNLPWVIDEWSSMEYRQHANNQIGVNAGWRSFWLRARKIITGYGFEQSLLIANAIRATSLPIVKNGLLGGRLGYLRLALCSRQCRRKPAHQLMFFISCVSLAVVNPDIRLPA
jgi:rhamnosyltransferase